MFNIINVQDFIRVPPDKSGNELKEALIGEIREKYGGFISKDIGLVVDIDTVHEIKDGIIIPGDGAYYYETVFDLITFNPDVQDVINGVIRDIADFGVFVNLGPIEGMVHISQSMNDFVSFSKEKVLTGKETMHTLKVGDSVRARVIAVSYKDPTNPKIGLTMRQPLMGKEDWISEELSKN